MTKSKLEHRILLAGGGSGGSAAPLIAIAQALIAQERSVKFAFLLVGTKNGPEREMAHVRSIEFNYLPVAKLRRYFSIRNLLLPFATFYALIKSFFILQRFKPELIIGAGSFVQVPLIIAGRILGIRCVIHQQDVVSSLSNYLCSFLAEKITVTFESSSKDFPDSFFLTGLKGNTRRTIHTGNPSFLPKEPVDISEAREKLHLDSNFPVILFVGGGTGAKALNEFVWSNQLEISNFAQILHITGPGKFAAGGKEVSNPKYHAMEFLGDMRLAYSAADIVVARAGLSTITELSRYAKVSIIIPMPNSHQEQNAFVLSVLQAAIIVDQKELSKPSLVRALRLLLFNLDLQKKLSFSISKLMPKDAASNVAEVVWEVLQSQRINTHV